MEDDFGDDREAPAYEFVWKQAVETTDTFLGMSGKDVSSACCEDLLLRVTLPDVASIQDIDVDLQPTSIKLRTTKQCATRFCPASALPLPLPLP